MYSHTFSLCLTIESSDYKFLNRLNNWLTIDQMSTVRKGFHFCIKIIKSITLVMKIRKLPTPQWRAQIESFEDPQRGRNWWKHFFHQTSPLAFSSQHEETFNPSLSVWTGDETRRVSRTRTLDTDTGNEMEI